MYMEPTLKQINPTWPERAHRLHDYSGHTALNNMQLWRTNITISPGGTLSMSSLNKIGGHTALFSQFHCQYGSGFHRCLFRPPLLRHTPKSLHWRCLEDSPGRSSYLPVPASAPANRLHNEFSTCDAQKMISIHSGHTASYVMAIPELFLTHKSECICWIYIYIYNYLFICFYLSIYLPIYPSVCPSVYLFIYLYLYLSIYLSIYLNLSQ